MFIVALVFADVFFNGLLALLIFKGGCSGKGGGSVIDVVVVGGWLLWYHGAWFYYAYKCLL